MKCIRFIVLLLMVIGSLNWGLVGFFGYNLVADILGGEMSTGARVVFALVGLAGLWGIGLLCRCVCCRSCSGSNKCGSSGCNCGGKCCGSKCNCSCHKEN